MSERAPQPPPVESWQAQNLRMIIFPMQPQVREHRNWWEELTGATPDSSVKRKTELEEAGVFDNVQMALSIDQVRMLWTATATAPTDAERFLDDAPMLGRFTDRRDWFVEHMVRWLQEHCPPVTRAAFAGTLLQPVANHEEGYRLLDKYLRHVEVFPDSSDFTYRINRRRPSGVLPNLSLNCLSTWSGVKMTAKVATQSAGAMAIQEGDTHWFAALELDINTAHEHKEALPADRLPQILRELAAAGTEIAQRGDLRQTNP